MGLKNLISKISSREQDQKNENKPAPEVASKTTPPPMVEAPSTAAGPLHKNMTMGEILTKYPSAQRALFQRYHIGGCHSCGFSETDTLEEVCRSHNMLSVSEVIDHILQSHEADQRIEITPQEATQLLKTDPSIKLIDVRTDDERRVAYIEGSQLISQELVEEMMTSWPKDTPIIFYCHHGIRSLDAASYFSGHGFSNVRSIRGGIDAWSAQVDPSISRY
jgi:rhodanese-related sulfurtransferase